MKSGRFNLKNAFWLVAMIVSIVAARDLAQQIPAGHSDAFKTDMYFDHPNEQQVQTRLSGAEAVPLPGGLLDVKDLQLESYSTNGLLQLVAKAPQCTYAMLDGRANSPGHLEMQSGDGKFYIEGNGFLLIWRQDATSLTISNQVHTLIQTGLLPP